MHAAGQMFIIRCQPDPFTGELLNVGVCGIDANGRRLVKVIDAPGRLRGLYGDSADSVVQMAQVAKEAAERGLGAPSNQLVFDAPFPFYNSTLAQAVQDCFRDQVTVVLPRPGDTQDLSSQDLLQELDRRGVFAEVDGATGALYDHLKRSGAFESGSGVTERLAMRLLLTTAKLAEARGYAGAAEPWEAAFNAMNQHENGQSELPATPRHGS